MCAKISQQSLMRSLGNSYRRNKASVLSPGTSKIQPYGQEVRGRKILVWQLFQTLAILSTTAALKDM
jgi:hypothetical protein